MAMAFSPLVGYGMTLLVRIDTSLAGTGSKVTGLDTRTQFVIGPTCVVRTVMLRHTLAPLARSPSWQVTKVGELPSAQPPEAETKTLVSGSWSPSRTLMDVSGP